MPYETALFLDKILRWAIPIGLPILFVWFIYSEVTRQPGTEKQKERSGKIIMFFFKAWLGLNAAFALLVIGFAIFGWIQDLFSSPTPTPTAALPTPSQPPIPGDDDWETVLIVLVSATILSAPVIQFGFWVEKTLRRHRPAWVGAPPPPPTDPSPTPRPILRPRTPQGGKGLRGMTNPHIPHPSAVRTAQLPHHPSLSEQKV